MKPTLYVVDWDGPGRLATMARPRGGDWLADEMAALAGAGVQILVSALRDDEYARCDLVDEPAAARAAGLLFVPFPIVDRGVPDGSRDCGALADSLAGYLRAGRFVAVHCWAGIGRSSLLAGTALVRLGMHPRDAWARIRRARGLPVPDMDHQERWLYDFAEADRDAA